VPYTPRSSSCRGNDLVKIATEDLAAISSGCKTLAEMLDNPDLYSLTDNEISFVVRAQLSLLLRRAESVK
jgi:hypothetical protein